MNGRNCNLRPVLYFFFFSISIRSSLLPATAAYGVPPCALFSSPRRPHHARQAAPCYRAYFLLPLDRTLLYPLYLCCAKCYSPFFSLSLSPRPAGALPSLHIYTYIHTCNQPTPHTRPCGSPCSIPPVYRLIIVVVVVSTLPPSLFAYHPLLHFYIAVSLACSQKNDLSRPPRRCERQIIPSSPLCARTRTALLFLCYFFSSSLSLHISPARRLSQSCPFYSISIQLWFCFAVHLVFRGCSCGFV